MSGNWFRFLSSDLFWSYMVVMFICGTVAGVELINTFKALATKVLGIRWGNISINVGKPAQRPLGFDLLK